MTNPRLNPDAQTNPQAPEGPYLVNPVREQYFYGKGFKAGIEAAARISDLHLGHEQTRHGAVQRHCAHEISIELRQLIEPKKEPRNG